MRSSRFASLAASPLALLLAGVSLGGLLSTAYARETTAWAAEAIGVDWFDLVIAVPWIAVCGVGAQRESYRWRVLLAGAYAYTVYQLVIYAFAVHFNALFLVYCATLGLAGFALVALVQDLGRRVEEVEPRSARIAGGLLVALGVAFGWLWLAEDVPALLRNTPPRTLVETGLFTNPVHVIDLAFVLPLHILAGISIWRRRSTGLLLAPVLLAFDVVMAASIGAMMIVMHANGAEAAAPVTVAMLVVAAGTAAVLFRLRHARGEHEGREPGNRHRGLQP